MDDDLGINGVTITNNDTEMKTNSNLLRFVCASLSHAIEINKEDLNMYDDLIDMGIGPPRNKTMEKIDTFIRRLKNIGIDIELMGNVPWIYIYSVNGHRVVETFKGEHGFTIAFYPIRAGQEIVFTDLPKIFDLIRKYK